MTSAVIKGLPTEEVRRLQNGGPDANGDIPEIEISDGDGLQCRHCLTIIGKGEECIVFSHKPFNSTQPYAERGPIYLHKHQCEQYVPNGALPESLSASAQFMVRGYNSDERIIYGTGRIVPTDQVQSYASELFEDENVDFVHVRSASNNCYQARIERE